MTHSESQNELLTPAAVAALLYVDPKTVARWAAAGKLAAVRTPGGHRRYLRSDVLAIVSGIHPDRPEDGHDKEPYLGLDLDLDIERQAAAAAVVAEAVALAAEAAAAEAADAVLATAVAVTQAAGRAADAAENAREARSLAAQTAAQCVAVEAERTADRIRLSADLAAARVQQAASLAAEELARLIAMGGPLDPERMAEVLAATVLAAAEVKDEDTTRAAEAVTVAASEAAAHLAQTLAAGEKFVQNEVAAVASAQRELAADTAAAVALETDARAAVVALAATEAATDLLAQAQWARDLDQKQDHGATEESGLPTPVHEALSERRHEIEEILAAAAQRDSRAETRDWAAGERERAASRSSLLGLEPDPLLGALPGWRTAAMDRVDAMTDRSSAASDRAWLSAHPPSASGVSGLSNGAQIPEVAAELSHDLRVPLSSIMASVEMLEDELGGHCDGSIAALLARATRAGERMARMLEQNMTPIAGANSLALPEVDLHEVVRQLVMDSADILEPADALVEADALPVLRADPDGMYSVLQNLLTNAVKFARPGVPARVLISAHRSAAGWRISVRDNGVGLPPTGVDVFSLFSRGTDSVAGHGIGLATVSRIVSEHGGHVGATPLEAGAEIWFELPEDQAVG